MLKEPLPDEVVGLFPETIPATDMPFVNAFQIVGFVDAAGGQAQDCPVKCNEMMATQWRVGAATLFDLYKLKLVSPTGTSDSLKQCYLQIARNALRELNSLCKFLLESKEDPYGY